MLNPFPIQFLALYAYFLLRVFVGALLLKLGVDHLSARYELRYVLTLSWWPYGRFTTLAFALGEIIIGLMFLSGFYTQIAALATAAMASKMLILRRRFNHPSIPSKLFYVLLLGCAATLFITGAGKFAFDLPI